MVSEACAYETARLRVSEWHSASGRYAQPTLEDAVLSVVTESVTRTLPEGWQGEFTLERASNWIAERDDEGIILLVREKSSNSAIGLVILHEDPSGVGTLIDIQLGYMLAESAWGKGLASELVAGFVDWCLQSHRIHSVVGGVAPDNAASIQVLVKNGFEPAQDPLEGPDAEEFYELRL